MPSDTPSAIQLSQVIAQVTAPSFLLGAVAAFISLLIARMNRIIDRSTTPPRTASAVLLAFAVLPSPGLHWHRGTARREAQEPPHRRSARQPGHAQYGFHAAQADSVQERYHRPLSATLCTRIAASGTTAA